MKRHDEESWLSEFDTPTTMESDGFYISRTCANWWQNRNWETDNYVCVIQTVETVESHNRPRCEGRHHKNRRKVYPENQHSKIASFYLKSTDDERNMQFIQEGIFFKKSGPTLKTSIRCRIPFLWDRTLTTSKCIPHLNKTSNSAIWWHQRPQKKRKKKGSVGGRHAVNRTAIEIEMHVEWRGEIVND